MDHIHLPVMPKECLEALAPNKDGVFLDGTAGLGGHSELLAESGCRLICIDRDGDAVARTAQRLARFGSRVTVLRGNFSELDTLLDSVGIGRVDGILLDLGVSSMQLDTPERGFSYRFDAPLDMRMDAAQTLTAEEIVNGWDVRELTRILY
ncbi:MAG: 16S rRNA (cytosine(1402)-N(4))-methyltransferase RsmH, partial [Oscillospiraceae bacterium]|nr:16S rRNA (cytosine(1402)-N(4))-methyltransferase RsmH [Oscillospiraceae bacterium]